jgi:hypothetical protein
MATLFLVLLGPVVLMVLAIGILVGHDPVTARDIARDMIDDMFTFWLQHSYTECEVCGKSTGTQNSLICSDPVCAAMVDNHSSWKEEMTAAEIIKAQAYLDMERHERKMKEDMAEWLASMATREDLPKGMQAQWGDAV